MDLDLLLARYDQLVGRIDAHAAAVSQQFPQALACHAGCDSCCRHLSLFPVELAALSRELQRRPQAEQTAILAQLTAPAAGCPLLLSGLCGLYAARPLICRTHGLPLLLAWADGGQRVDHCPLNFQGCDRLPGTAVLELERLNQLLVAINALFVQQAGLSGRLAERLPLAAGLRLWQTQS